MPLAARGVVLACRTFALAGSSPPFGPADVAAADELASRAAACIDNARLYDREGRSALALQRSLLPGESRVPAGAGGRAALPAGDLSVVGGDWHDIVALPGGRAALIVGDAMGHDPEAAAVMVQLRTAAHALAELDLASRRPAAQARPNSGQPARRPVRHLRRGRGGRRGQLLRDRGGGAPAPRAGRAGRPGPADRAARRAAAWPRCRIRRGDGGRAAARGDSGAV